MMQINLRPQKQRPAVITNRATDAEVYIRSGRRISLTRSSFRALLLFYAQLEIYCRQTDDLRLKKMASKYVLANFRDYLKGEGRQAFDFTKGLVDEYLVQRNDTCLVFNLKGATALEMIAGSLASKDKKAAIKGLHLNMGITGVRDNQPLIIKYLEQSGVFEYKNVVFVDTGYRGTVSRRMADMLADQRLIRYTEEEFETHIPHVPDVQIRLLMLRDKERLTAKYDIDGYNYSQPQLSGSLDRLAFILDEAMVTNGSGFEGIRKAPGNMVTLTGQIFDTECFRLMKQALREVLGATGLPG